MTNETVWICQDPKSSKWMYTEDARELWRADWRWRRFENRECGDIGAVQVIEYAAEPGVFYIRDWSDDRATGSTKTLRGICYDTTSCVAGPIDSLEAAQATAEMYVCMMGRL